MDLVDTLALSKLPSEGVLTAAIADQQYAQLVGHVVLVVVSVTCQERASEVTFYFCAT